MNGSHGSHTCCGTGMFSRAETTSTLTASNVSHCGEKKSKLFLFLSLPVDFVGILLAQASNFSMMGLFFPPQ